MAFKKPTLGGGNGGGAIELRPVLEVGMYPARIYQVVDLGLQPGSAAYPDPKYKLEIGFELLDENMVDKDGNAIEGSPAKFTMEIAYNPDGYMHEKSGIFKFYSAVNPEFDKGPEELLTLPCMVMVVQDKRKSGKFAGEIYSKVTAVAPMKAKDIAKAPALVNAPLYFDLSEPLLDSWAQLTKGNQYAQQDRIKNSLEYAKTPLPALLGEAVAAPSSAPVQGQPDDIEIDPSAFEGDFEGEDFVHDLDDEDPL